MKFSNIDKNYIDLADKQTKFKNVHEKIKKIALLKENKLAYYSFLITVLMTIYLCITSVGGELGFLFKVPILKYEFILFPIIGMIIFMFILKKDKEKYFWLIPIISIILYFVICFGLSYICGKFWDISSDSLGYHDPMILDLFNKINPVYNMTLNHSPNIWDIHYPKANAVYATMIFQLTGKFAHGKILSLLIPILSAMWGFSFIVAALAKRKKITSITLGVLGGFLILINPVNLEQALTFYLDSSLGGMMIITIIMVFFLIFFEELKFFKLSALVLIIAFTSNIKFTGLIYSIGILGGLFIFYLFYGTRKEIKKMFFYLLWTFIFAGLIVGFNPYITNIISNHNPFYPLMGKNAVNIMNINTPAYLLNKSNPIQWVDSLFANITNGVSSSGNPIHHFSQLFTINDNILKLYALPDPRLRGLGILSFIIEPLSFILFIVLLIKIKKTKINKFFIGTILILAVISLILTLVAGGYWWARYTPFFWILPTILVIGLLINRSIIFKSLGVLLLLLIIINCLVFIPAFKYKEQSSNKFKNMVFYGNDAVVKGAHGWQIMEEKFQEYNIPYQVIEKVKS